MIHSCTGRNFSLDYKLTQHLFTEARFWCEHAATVEVSHRLPPETTYGNLEDQTSDKPHSYVATESPAGQSRIEAYSNSKL